MPRCANIARSSAVSSPLPFVLMALSSFLGCPAGTWNGSGPCLRFGLDTVLRARQPQVIRLWRSQFGAMHTVRELVLTGRSYFLEQPNLRGPNEMGETILFFHCKF